MRNMSIKELSNGDNTNLGSIFHFSKTIVCFQIKKNMAENSISWKICSTRTPNEPQFEFSKLSSNFEGCHLAVRRCNWSKAAHCYSLFLTTGQRSLSSQWGKFHVFLFWIHFLNYPRNNKRSPFHQILVIKFSKNVWEKKCSTKKDKTWYWYFYDMKNVAFKLKKPTL